MLAIKILVVTAIAVLCIFWYKDIVAQNKKTALAEARDILLSLRGESDQLQNMSPEDRVDLLQANCGDAGVTLEDLGTSQAELTELCRKLHKRKS